MTVLSAGAVALPTAHVSVRVAWHDTDWTGRVCASPSTNHSCSVLKNVKENKQPSIEDDHAGVAWEDLEDPKLLPPCVNERAGFMRPLAFTQQRTHNYAWKKSGPHGHFAPTPQRMAPYSLEVTPFRWVMRGEIERYITPWGISYDAAVEDHINGLMSSGGWSDETWVQHKANQEALLDSFFSALQPRRSLVFLYAKDIPLIEERGAGERYLIGAGFVEGVDPAVEWEYDGEGPVSSIMWERGVSHSIRPGFADGFLLPYHELLANPELQGEDLEQFVARTPAEHFEEFSYVSEHVSDDGAIAALTELARVVDLLPDVATGPWAQVATWIADRLSEAWQARGPYPGMGPMLAAAGLERGAVLARRVQASLPDGAANPWPALEDAVANNLDKLVGRMARKAFAQLTADGAAYRKLRVMSRFALAGPQARELWEALPPETVLDNPYSLYEHAAREPVALTTIDRGLFPQDPDALAALALDPIDDPVTEASDDRRVRAACGEVLARAAERGHTLLDEPGLRVRLADLELTPRCDPTDAAFSIAAADFLPRLVERPLARGGRGWQLRRHAQITDLLRAQIADRLAAPALELTWDWAQRIDGVLPPAADDEAEREARKEKAEALRLLVRGRISVLIGPAGSGKTSMLRALCADPHVQAGGVLLLAPTGKAAVQLRRGTGLPTKNLAQFCGSHERWDYESGDYYLKPGAKRHSASKTVVIDEASMLTEAMLAATLDALDGVERLILCGDPRQLPPIGAGRPFVDLVAHLREATGPGAALAELRTSRRQVSDRSGTPDDVALASLFAPGGEVLGAEDTLARVLADGGDGRVSIISWDDEPDLHRKLISTLESETRLGLAGRTRGALCRSLGADCDDDALPRFPWGEAGAGAESWQLLSPVRARPGGVVALNELVRRTWRPKDVGLAAASRKFASPAGVDQAVFADKVMLLRNDHRRKATEVDGWESKAAGVANGEIGVIVRSAGPRGKQPTGHTLELSTQPGLQFTFWNNELNGDNEQRGEWLQLAYAITIHKSQGSQFKTVIVVVPDPCALLSPELLYTALTRQVDRVILFKQGDPAGLRAFADPARSETAGRLTCLLADADPFLLPDGKTTVDGRHVHRTARGDDLVRSKSEVIVADTLHNLGIPYRYEQRLQFPDEIARHPDFTIERAGDTPIYWEHLGRLDLAGYRADWQARKAWYASHGVLPLQDGGGPGGILVCSDENVSTDGIDSSAVRDLAERVRDLVESADAT